jgi:thymidylate synthase (FAD)
MPASETTQVMMIWAEAMRNAERDYFKLLDIGCSAQEARGVLPNDLKTEFVTTMTLRAWRHFFKLRCSKAAHPQIRWLAIFALRILRGQIPVVFDDIYPELVEDSK